MRLRLLVLAILLAAPAWAATWSDGTQIAWSDGTGMAWSSESGAPSGASGRIFVYGILLGLW